MTVKECVLKILGKNPNLSNQAIAAQVRDEMKSNTTAKNIAWYKWNMQSTNNDSKIELSDEDAEIAFGFGDEIDEKDIKDWELAEDLIVRYEKQKGANVERIKDGTQPGYDIKSIYPTGEVRKIEVKSKKTGKKTWVNLTSNETNALLNEPKFWLYIVEGNAKDGNVQLVEISRIELLKSVKIKLHGRISNLSGYSRIDFAIN